MRKRILASLLTLVMILSLTPMTALAAGNDDTASRQGTQDAPWDISAEDGNSKVTAYLTDNSEIEATYGDTINLSPSTTYTLHIEGTGAMADYASNSNNGNVAPWKDSYANITRVEIGEGVTNIGSNAFRNAYGSYTFSISSTVQSIGTDALLHCWINTFEVAESSQYFKAVNGVLFSRDGTTLVCYPSNKTEISYVVPDGVTGISDYAFKHPFNLKTITFPNSLQTIGKSAFRGHSMQAIHIGSNSITEIKDLAFADEWDSCKTALTEIYLDMPNLQTLGDSEGSAIYGAKGITKAYLNIPTIPDSFLSAQGPDVAKLTELAFGPAVQSIGAGAFHSQTAIQVLDLRQTKSNHLTIGANAFNSCSGLIAVLMPAGLSSVGIGAFTSGTTIYFDDSIDLEKLTSTSQSYAKDSTILAVTNGGTFADNASFTSGTLATPTREGYEFDGWYCDSNYSGDAATSITAGQTYYAKWINANSDAQDAATTTLEGEGTAAPVEVPEGVTSESALDDAANEGTANTEPAAAAEQPAEEPEDAVPEETPEVTVPEEENVTEEPTEDSINSVEEVPADDTVTIQSALIFNDPAETTYYFYANENELGHTTETSLQYNTTQKGLAIGENTVEVYEGEKTDGNTPVGTIKVTLNQKALTVSGLKAVDRTANGSVDVTLTGGSLEDVENGDTVGFTATGAMSDKAAGDNKPVTVAVELTGTDAKWYTVTPPTDVTVNITSSSGSHSSGGSSSSTTYTVTVESAKNGDVKSDRASASKGATVTLTVTPKDGYELDSLKVTDKDGKTIKTTESKNGKYTFTMPASKVTVEASFAKIEEQSGATFRDVPASAYYYDAVEWAVEQGVTSGTSATTFSPDAACTRAQAVTFLWRAAGSPAPKSSVNPFTDVLPGAYYYDAVLWAVEKGITVGTTDTTFSPDVACTRAHIATFLWRAIGTAVTGSNPFTDVAASAYYVDAVKWAVANGVTVGTTPTTFSPNATCTRAQIVTFLYRAYAD